MKNTTLRTLAGPAVVVALAATLTGCSGLNSLLNRAEDAQRDEPGGEITASADADVFSLQVGDCLDYAALSSTATEVASVPTVPCGDPHDAEIYSEVKLTDEQFAQGDTFGEEHCRTAFATFIGKSYDESTLDFTYLSPSAESWATGDDVVQCIVIHPDGGVTGTLSASAL